jgi:hypothetical protein
MSFQLSDRHAPDVDSATAISAGSCDQHLLRCEHLANSFSIFTGLCEKESDAASASLSGVRHKTIVGAKGLE